MNTGEIPGKLRGQVMNVNTARRLDRYGVVHRGVSPMLCMMNA
jgi:hypothetical protein